MIAARRIAWHDLRLMVRDRVFFFWTLAFPLLFIFMFGSLFKSDPSPDRAALLVQNLDQGPWGAYFIGKIRSPGLALEVVTEEPKEFLRMLVLPKDFSERIQARQAQQLPFKQKSGASLEAGAVSETRILQAMTRLITELILHGDRDPAAFFRTPVEFRDLLVVRTRFPAGTLTQVPSGFDHVIPGVVVQFIVLMVLIYGGSSVMEDRKRGVLTRILSAPVSRAELFLGKFLGRLLLGLAQALLLIVTGLLFFHLKLGDPLLAALVVLVFAAAMSALSILLGSVIGKEDLIIGLAVLLSNVFAALGGCWWPIEVVPQTMRTVAMISPAYWAMDAFHQVIFFDRGFVAILPNLLVLGGLTVVFTLLASRFFRLRD